MAPAPEDHTAPIDHDQQPTENSHPAVRGEGRRSGLPRISEIGPYRIERTLGWGGMGIVYAAEDTRSGERVALKLLRFSDPEGVSLRRFQQEAEATRRLHHPGIVGLREVGRAEDYDYYAMDLVEGRDFGDWIKQERPSVDTIVRTLAKVARAVDHAHRRQLLHRDLKPGNVIIDQHGEPFVTDFGLARAIGAESSLTATDQAVGTPQYMSPEQARGRHQDCGPSSDVFALGVMLYEAVCDRQPFAGETVLDVMQAVVNEHPPLPRSVAPQVPPPLERIVLQCLEKDPRHRYQSAEAVAEDLERYLEGASVLARRYSTWTRALRWTRLRWKLVATALVLAGALGVAGWALTRDRGFDPGRWVEAWRWDCTTQGVAEVEVELVYAGPQFDAAPTWDRGEHGLRPQRAVWAWLEGVRVAGDVRVELEVRTRGHLDGIEIALSSEGGELPGWSAVPRGYSCQFAGYTGTLSFISRNEVPDAASFAYGTASQLVEERDYTLAFSRVGERLWLEVDGREILAADYPLPMVGERMDRIGFRTYSHDLELRAVSVHRLAGTAAADPLAMPDAALQLGRFDEAIDGYVATAEAYGGGLAARALGRAYLASLQLGEVTTERREGLRERLFGNHGDSAIALTVLEVEAAGAWRAGEFASAFDLIAECFRRDRGSQVMYRILETRLNPPREWAAKFLACLGRTRDLRSLRIRALGIDDLSPLAGLELEWLDAEGNEITDLAPLRGMPLVLLRVKDSRIEDLEPLRGMHLRQLVLSGNPVSDLAPLRGQPLEYLNLEGCQNVADITALAGMDIGRLHLQNTGATVDLRLLASSGMADLRLDGCRILGAEALARLRPRRLVLDRAGLEDGLPLAGARFTDLSLVGIGLEHLADATDAEIDRLDLGENRIADLSPLAAARIDRVLADRNRIADLRPLRATGAGVIHARGNPLTAEGCLGLPARELLIGDFAGETTALELDQVAELAAAWRAADERPALARALADLLRWRRGEVEALRASARSAGDRRWSVLPVWAGSRAARELATELGAVLPDHAMAEDLVGSLDLPPGYSAWLGGEDQDGHFLATNAAGAIWDARDHHRHIVVLVWAADGP